MNVEEVKNALSNFKDLLDFKQVDDYVKITPISYLGAEKFKGIIDVLKPLGGEYVSAGKDSHFRIAVTTNTLAQLHKPAVPGGMALNMPQDLKNALELLDERLDKFIEAYQQVKEIAKALQGEKQQ